MVFGRISELSDCRAGHTGPPRPVIPNPQGRSYRTARSVIPGLVQNQPWSVIPTSQVGHTDLPGFAFFPAALLSRPESDFAFAFTCVLVVSFPRCVASP